MVPFSPFVLSVILKYVSSSRFEVLPILDRPSHYILPLSVDINSWTPTTPRPSVQPTTPRPNRSCSFPVVVASSSILSATSTTATSPVVLFTALLSASIANSFTYMLKYTGEDGAPWGTPLVRVAHLSDGSPFMRARIITSVARAMLTTSSYRYSFIVLIKKCR